MVLQQSKSINVAYLFHQEDQSIFESLAKYLEGLRRENLIEELSEILPGMDPQEQIKHHLSIAEVIILLVSYNFDGDKFFNSSDVVSIIRERYERGIHVWPIIAKSFQWKRSPFQEYEIFFGEDKSIVRYTPQDDAYNQIAEKIGDQITRMLSEKWVYDGDMYYHNMRLPEALIAYEQSLNLIPNFVPALFGKGLTLRKQGMIEDANQCFEAIISLNKTNAKDIESFNSKRKFTSLACYKGLALLELRRFSEARIAFQEVHNQSIPPNREQNNVYAEAYYGEGNACCMQASKSVNFQEYYEQAFRAYTMANQLVPYNPKYLLGIAKVHTELGIRLQPNSSLQSKSSFEDALNICEHVIHINPDYAPAYIGRGDIYFHLRYFNDALLSYNKAIQINQHEAQAYGGKGFVLLCLHNPQEALSAFDSAIFNGENIASFLYGKGRSLAKLGFYQEALDFYTQARTQGFDSLELLYYRAETLVALGEAEFLIGRKAQGAIYYKESEDIYKSYLRQNGPMPENVYFQWGKIFLSYESWDKAMICYERAISFAPRKANGYLGMGKVFTKLSRYNDGLMNLGIASGLQDKGMIDSADIDIAYGDIYSCLAGDPGSKEYYDYQKKAQEHFEKATFTHKSVMAYIGLGKAYQALHYYENAIEAFDEALKINPNLSNCYFLKGKCCQALGWTSSALDFYEKAISLGFDDASIQIAKGDVLMSMKSYVAAEAVFDKIINASEKDTAHIFCKKGAALHELKRDEEAVRAFRQAYSIDNSICLQPEYKRTLEDIISSFEMKLRYNQPTIVAYISIGDILLILDILIEKAVEVYTAAIGLGDTSSDTYFNRGEAYSRLYKARRLLQYGVNAVKDYKKALELDPKLSSLVQQGEAVVKDITAQQNFVRRFIFMWRTM